MNNLQAKRECRNYSQAELARRSGVKQSVINYIEHGKTKNPRIDTARALAKALRCKIDDLFPPERK